MARVLILGGTAEAAELAARLAGDDRLETVTSLAGLTRLPNRPAGQVRQGGFGGPHGLAALLKEEGYGALVDATHPFAAQIAHHAAEAAEAAGIPRLKLVRPPFERKEDIRFVPVASMEEASAAIPSGARVFLAAGRRELAPFAARKDIWCLLRMIEPPAPGEVLPPGELVLGRPAADPETEMELLQTHRIDHLVSKDSGGRAGAKIEAARRLGLPVILIERPPVPPGDSAGTVDECIVWLERTLFRAREEIGRV
ncbi:cobalt-precorrin-6A reductase [Faunimonas sp. B44]|uniref:cobalt-precorrin-6A reductase n=1 Tax=Faunimonas sp. B44 TaxID=3461493 RepID=UPI004044155F